MKSLVLFANLAALVIDFAALASDVAQRCARVIEFGMLIALFTVFCLVAATPSTDV